MNCFYLLFIVLCSLPVLTRACFGGSTKNEVEESMEEKGRQVMPEPQKIIGAPKAGKDFPEPFEFRSTSDQSNDGGIRDKVESFESLNSNGNVKDENLDGQIDRVSMTATTDPKDQNRKINSRDDDKEDNEGFDGFKKTQIDERTSTVSIIVTGGTESTKETTKMNSTSVQQQTSSSTMEMNGNSEGRNKENKEEKDKGAEDLKLNLRFVQTYLRQFGYLNKEIANNNAEELRNNAEFHSGLERFQEYIGVPPSGKMDLLTTEEMLRKRCSNADISRHEKIFKIWERSTLKWHLAAPNDTSQLANWMPKFIEFKDLKELIREAFFAWEIVISMEFVEEPNDARTADIVFYVGDDIPDNSNDSSGLSIASGTGPEKSRIWLKRDENWATFQVQEEGKIDIFLVLIHEIGHALGLDHSRDRNSVMFPILEREVGAQLPVISNDDVERLRMLYDPDEVLNVSDDIGATLDNSFSNNTNARKCPSAVWAVTQLWPRGDIFVFLDVNCWRFDRNRRLIDGPKLVTEMFPNAPLYADVAITSANLTVLIRERTLYGYTMDEESGAIMKLPGYPKSLHSRVLFYPDAAFPLSNGSVILLRDNVFATYDLVSNEPSILNDKNVVFPNLPTALRAGIFAYNSEDSGPSDHRYWMMTGDTVVEYDSFSTSAHGKTQPLARFFGCESSKPSSESSTDAALSHSGLEATSGMSSDEKSKTDLVANKMAPPPKDM